MIDQNSQFMAILTAVGEAKQANANALGVPWIISQMAVGDANGTNPMPSRTQSALINERRRAPLNQLKIDPDNSAMLIAEQVIPEQIGGFWIREIGLYDEDDDLVAVANCPPTFKPELSQGSGRTQVVRLNILVSSTQNIQLKIDPSVVLATRGYVDDLTVQASKEEAEKGIENNKLMTPSLVSAAIAVLAVPTGTVVAFAGTQAPANYLICNGAELSRELYDRLFAVIGTAYGSGDGVTTFQLPDLRGEFIRGWDAGRGVDVGRELATVQLDEFKSHNHPIGTYYTNGAGSSSAINPSSNSHAMSGYAGGNETRPRNVAMNYIIKY